MIFCQQHYIKDDFASTMILCRKDSKLETWPEKCVSPICLDCEVDWEKLVDKDPATTVLYAEKLSRARRYGSNAVVGFSGLPNPPSGQEQKVADGMRILLGLCDYLNPCCYDWGGTDEEMEARAKRTKACIDLMALNLPILARVSPTYQLTGDGKNTLISKEKLIRQVKAAKSIGADGLYMWCGLEYWRWVSLLKSNDPTVAKKIQNARDTIKNIYGIKIVNWTEDEVNSKCARWAQLRIKWFTDLWNTVG